MIHSYPDCWASSFTKGASIAYKAQCLFVQYLIPNFLADGHPTNTKYCCESAVNGAQTTCPTLSDLSVFSTPRTSPLHRIRFNLPINENHNYAVFAIPKVDG